jgi:hypothetical protein
VGHPAHLPGETDDLNAVGGHCPRCGAEYRPGFHVCADCNIPLVPGPSTAAASPPDQPEEDLEPRDVAVVCRLPWEEAWLMAGRLRTARIDAAVSPDNYVRLPYGTRTSFDVLVPADRLEEARRVAATFLRA